MFKIDFDPEEESHLIKPEDLLPNKVENTRGKIQKFKPQKIVDSLVNETDLERKDAIKITTSVLRKISSLGLKFIAAPHIRELVCGELTAQEFHKERNQYTRLGMPVYDVKQVIEGQFKKKKEDFNPLFTYLWLTSQAVEQFVHLDELSDAASALIDGITKDAEKLNDEEKKVILNSLDNSLKLFREKQEKDS